MTIHHLLAAARNVARFLVAARSFSNLSSRVPMEFQEPQLLLPDLHLSSNAAMAESFAGELRAVSCAGRFLPLLG